VYAIVKASSVMIGLTSLNSGITIEQIAVRGCKKSAEQPGLFIKYGIVFCLSVLRYRFILGKKAAYSKLVSGTYEPPLSITYLKDKPPITSVTTAVSNRAVDASSAK